MSWFDDHQEELAQANISREDAEDFVRRNTTTDESGTERADYHRVFEALGEEREADRENSEPSRGGGGGDDSYLSSRPNPYQPFSERFEGPPVRGYQPFTERFAGPSVRGYQPFTETYTAPTWGRTFTAPTRPSDLMDRWGQTFRFDPSKIAENPAYRVRLSDMVKSVERSAAAKGLSFTPQAREELLQRAGALASQELENEYGRQVGAYGTNYGTFSGDRARRGREADRTFDETLGTYRQGRGDFEADRGFGRATFLDRAGIHDLNEGRRYASEADAFDRARATFLDRAGIHNINEGGRYGSEADAFNRARSTFMDRANIHNVNESGRYGSERSNLLDTRAWDTDLFGRDRARDEFGLKRDYFGLARDDSVFNRGRLGTLDTRAWDSELWGRGRTDRNDQWGRGQDLWNQNRTQERDRATDWVSFSDLILRGGKPPDWWPKG